MSWKENAKTLAYCCATFFITVATILGSGILALPVKVSESGFWPFVVSFVLTIVAQTYCIVFTVDLLQISQKVIDEELPDPTAQTPEPEREDLLDVEMNEVSLSQMQENEETEELSTKRENLGTDIVVADRPEPGEEEGEIGRDQSLESENVMKETKNEVEKFPDFYNMGKMFIHPKLLWLYYVTIVLGFVSIMISYSLAGPQSIAKLLNIIGVEFDHLYYFFILPFVVILASIIVFGAKIIEFIISGLTFIKGCLLVVMIMLTGIVSISPRISNPDPAGSNWRLMGRPFLIGTLALGGAPSTLTIVFSKLKLTKHSVRLFRISSILGVVACAVLNLFWSFFVLRIVPFNRMAEALEKEQISTIPLIDIIEENFPEFEWLSYLVDIFVTTSICVSFLCLGSGMKHILDGIPKSVNEEHKLFKWMKRKLKKPKLFMKMFLYLLFFSTTYLIAQTNPQTFFIVMDIFASFSFNAGSGFFVCLMVWNAYKKYGRSNVKIANKMSTFSHYIMLPLVFAFFAFAIGYDFFFHGIEIITMIVNIPRPEGEKISVPF